MRLGNRAHGTSRTTASPVTTSVMLGLPPSSARHLVRPGPSPSGRPDGHPPASHSPSGQGYPVSGSSLLSWMWTRSSPRIRRNGTGSTVSSPGAAACPATRSTSWSGPTSGPRRTCPRCAVRGTTRLWSRGCRRGSPGPARRLPARTPRRGARSGGSRSCPSPRWPTGCAGGGSAPRPGRCWSRSSSAGGSRGRPPCRPACCRPLRSGSWSTTQFRGYYSQYPAASFAAKVWTNNVLVAFESLIFGILLGLPTLLVLFNNAVNLGVGRRTDDRPRPGR